MRQTFAEKIASQSDFQRKLKFFSVSDMDAQNRENVIKAVINQTMEINALWEKKSGRRAFAASVTAGNLDGSTIYAAVMRSFVNNIAPIFAVQRVMDTPKQQLMYVDMYDILNNELIVPNIGPDKAWLDQTNSVTEAIDVSVPYTITSGDPVLPKTFQATLSNNGTVVGTIIDDGAGNFLASPGLLADGSQIVYNNGGASTILLKFAAGLTANQIMYNVLFDVTSKEMVNRAYGKSDYYNMETSPLLVPVERNIITDHAMAKQGIINNDELYANFIENEYTKVINNMVYRTLLNHYVGDTYQIDLSSFSLAAGRIDTLTRAFKNALTQGENRIAEQTYKEAKVTGILAGHDAVDMFNLLTQEQGWVKNENRSYYKDIVGWIDQVPVVLTNTPGLASDEVMLTHRTADGQVAPLFHGIFLAPTELPIVANYRQITDYTSGLYSMEGMGYTSSKLCLKIKFKYPEDLKVVKL